MLPKKTLARLLAGVSVAMTWGGTPREAPAQEPPVDITAAAPAKRISPSDVFAKADLVNRQLDALLTHLRIDAASVPQIALRESGLKPMHIYQLHLTCLDQFRLFEQERGLTVTPLIIASPVKYGPGDVYELTSLLSRKIERAARSLGVGEIPLETRPASKKTPTDVYSRVVPALTKLLALNKTLKVTPSEVFAQIARVRQDAQAIISKVASNNPDAPAKRRRLQAKAYGMSTDGRHLELDTSIKRAPAEAFEACLQLRRTINRAWLAMKRPSIPLPTQALEEKIGPSDVYLQTQIIIAELNLLKRVTGTSAPTPPTDLFAGKTPAEVRAEALWADFILAALVDELEEAAKGSPSLTAVLH